MVASAFAPVRATAVLLVVVAVVGLGSTVYAVARLSQDVHPAQQAHRAALQDVTDMALAAAAYERSDDRAHLVDHRTARERWARHAGLVEELAVSDRALAAVVAAEVEETRAWTRASLRPGDQPLDDVRAAHDRTVAALERELAGARGLAVTVGGVTLVLLVVVATSGAWLMGRSRRLLLAEVAGPLAELERAARRLASSGAGERAEQTGSREVRSVAAALNQLAEAEDLARAVELRVHQELRYLDTARSDFVANVSHELRTPLATISGYLELINDEFDGRVAPHHQKMLDAMRRNVGRLRLLIEDLLTLSRAESGVDELEEVDLAAIVVDVVTDLRIPAANRGIRIDLGLVAGERLSLLADRPMLQRALRNVVGNAVKFTQGSGVVDVSVSRDADDLLVVVRDHGIGIPAGELDRLGTRFFRASNAVAKEIAGTGLGVRIVQEVVDEHRGELRVQSVEGEGTTVTVRLPQTSARPVPHGPVGVTVAPSLDQRS
ncbi:sensor histidine kinase [Nocardioides sp. GCM10027113]|uniref:sensor histidine kinase n=1 Tax=unclassified Nocardioides TaxID=2615069 RepID=UPI003613A4C7